jgi:hypothetical protein
MGQTPERKEFFLKKEPKNVGTSGRVSGGLV